MHKELAFKARRKNDDELFANSSDIKYKDKSFVEADIDLNTFQKNVEARKSKLIFSIFLTAYIDYKLIG